MWKKLENEKDSKICPAPATNLQKPKKDKKYYEADNVFPKILIDKIIDKLKAYKDKDLWKNLADKPEKIENLLKQYLHNG
ncbi:MAG: hypothetical protein QMD20_00440 [Candidatus Bathyarchaeia archaeon]|nr:hypothetical protein [Candidatus Bathyarchaeia archaeon]